MRPSFPLLAVFSCLIFVARGYENFRGSSGVIRGESSIKIGTGASSRGSGTGRGNSGVRIGEGKNPSSTRQRVIPSTTTTTTPQPHYVQPTPPHSSNSAKNATKIYLKVCLAVKYLKLFLPHYIVFLNFVPFQSLTEEISFSGWKFSTHLNLFKKY